MKRTVQKLDSIDEILSLEGCSSPGYCSVRFNDKMVIFGGSIANLSVNLDERFLRISRTVLVNRNKIASFTNQSVTLENGVVFNISRRKQPMIAKVLG